MAESLIAATPKLKRVKEGMQAIQGYVNTYSARYPAELITDPQGKTTINRSEPPPIEIAILAGEAIYQMRSMLDHLAFDLVKLNPSGITLPADWHEKCEFPIWTKPLKPGQTPPLPYGCFRNLPGITKQAHAFIESVQPYYPTGNVNSSLGQLAQLSNIDKHRHLAITRARSYVHEHRTWSTGLRTERSMTVNHGTEIDVRLSNGNHHTVEVDFTVAALVTFDEPILGDACTVPVQVLLEYSLDALEGFIIPAFHKLIKNP